MILKIAKNFYFGLALLVFLSACLIACDKYTNISVEQPYAEAIGKYFVLQRDYYLYQVHGATHTYIGCFYALPKIVDQRYIGLKNNEVSIIGLAKAGQLIQLSKFFEETAVLAGSFNFLYVSLINGSNSNFHELDATGLMNMGKTPPFTKTWSDPPIFKADAALPLPSDGIWWK